MFALRRKSLLIIYGAAAATLTLSFFSAYPIPGLLTRLGELARAVLVLAASAAVGRGLFRRTGLDGRLGLAEGDPDLWIWSAALGLLPLSLALLLSGGLGFFSPGWVLAVVGLWSVAGAAEWRGSLAFLARGGEGVRLGPWLPGTLAGLGLLALLCAFAPPTYYDSLVYHLALPLRYLQEGAVGFVPDNHYSHFPQNMELLFAVFLASGSDVAAQVFNVLLAGLSGVVVARMAGTPGKGWSLLLFAAAPCTLLLSTETYVEAPQALFTTLAVWGALRALQEDRPAWFVAAGLAAGFGMGVKYTGALTPALLVPLVILWPGPRPLRRRLRDGAILGGTALAVFLPWLVKNALMTGGNPVFPFLPSLFPARHVELYRESSEAYFRVFGEYGGKSALLFDLIKVPFRLAENPQSFGGGFDLTGDIGWLLPLMGLPLAYLFRRPSRAPALVYIALHLVLWASFRPVLRFLYPVFPLLCLLAGEGFSDLWARARPPLRGIMGAWVGLFLLSNGVLFYLVERVRDPFPVALGLEPREAYLSKKLDYYPAMAFMREGLPADARVFFIGDQRAHYCPRRHSAPMALLPQPLRAWAERAKDGEALRRELLGRGYTHVFFNEKEGERLKGYGVLVFSPQGETVFRDFLGRLTPVFRTETTAVLELGAP